jgi:hypothetical protein
MMSMVRIASMLGLSVFVVVAQLNTVEGLSSQYNHIVKTGNRSTSLEERVRVDAKSISGASGVEKHNVLWIGASCAKPQELEKTFRDPFSGFAQKLSNADPEAKRSNGKLVGAVYRDGGYPNTGMNFTDSTSLIHDWHNFAVRISSSFEAAPRGTPHRRRNHHHHDDHHIFSFGLH